MNLLRGTWLERNIREARGHSKGDHEKISPECQWCFMRMCEADEESILTHVRAYLDAMPKEILARAL